MSSPDQLIEQAQSVRIELFLEGPGKKVKVRYQETRRAEVSPILALLREHKQAVASALHARLKVDAVAPCGSHSCAGCYSLYEGGPKIHPPRCSPEWRRWSERWQRVTQ